MNPEKLSLFLPFALSTVSQKFGDNANPLYAGQGLKGHTAYDFAVPWGSPIHACVDGPVYSGMLALVLDISMTLQSNGVSCRPRCTHADKCVAWLSIFLSLASCVIAPIP